jgi:CHASE3 domain sensor protein
MLQIPHRGKREYYTTTHGSNENIAQHQADIWKILQNNTEVRKYFRTTHKNM